MLSGRRKGCVCQTEWTGSQAASVCAGPCSVWPSWQSPVVAATLHNEVQNRTSKLCQGAWHPLFSVRVQDCTLSLYSLIRTGLRCQDTKPNFCPPHFGALSTNPPVGSQALNFHMATQLPKSQFSAPYPRLPLVGFPVVAFSLFLITALLWSSYSMYPTTAVNDAFLPFHHLQ